MSKWVELSERKPNQKNSDHWGRKASKEIIVCDINGIVYTSVYMVGEEFIQGSDYQGYTVEVMQVKYWMKVPKPPKNI